MATETVQWSIILMQVATIFCTVYKRKLTVLIEACNNDLNHRQKHWIA